MLGAPAGLVELADRLGAGVAKALLGKDVVSDELPGVTGGIWLLGTRPSHELMTHCDALLVVGSKFPYSQFLLPTAVRVRRCRPCRSTSTRP